MEAKESLVPNPYSSLGARLLPNSRKVYLLFLLVSESRK